MPTTPIIDSALPALPLAFDLEAVSRGFEELWGRMRGRRLTVERCTRIDARYQPGLQCLITYELAGNDARGANARTFGVLDVDRSGAIQRVFPDDPELPALVMAADVGVMRERLAAPPGEGTAQSAIDTCEVTPMRYKPGQRCAIRYDMYSHGRRTARFGKLLATGGDRLMATLVALHSAGAVTSEMPRVPRPLYYFGDLEMVVQPAVTGTALTAHALDMSPTGVCSHLMHSAGRGLGALHQAVRANGPRRTLEDDGLELRDYGNLFTQLAPRLAHRFDEVVTTICGLAAASEEPAPVASHGALRTDQFLVDRDGSLVLIDLDGFCWAAPARDVGNLLAYLDWRAIRRPQEAARIDEARRAFLEGYASISPLTDSVWLATFRAASMLKIAGRRFRCLSFDEWKLVPQLLDAARDTLPR